MEETEFITLEELLFALEAEYPDLVGGRDYLLERRFRDGKQREDAYIIKWPGKYPMPTSQWINESGLKVREKLPEIRMRSRRDAELAATDWTQSPDAPVDIRTKYAEYRQALRDLPEQPGWPDSVQWPTAPK
ncbi:phage tail assembly chaperone [Burkholderia cenocepacia]|nr:phage tail assembly chaperone [Burkholderia cenocepacia]